MKRKGFWGLSVFGLMVLSVFLFLNPLSSDSQVTEKRVPDQGVSAPIPDEELESKNPGRTPHVAPQPYTATEEETIGLETSEIVSETVAGDGTPGGETRLQTGFAFGEDRGVSTSMISSTAGYRTNPDVAVSSEGHIYVAAEVELSGVTYIQVFRSTDYGKTWDSIFYSYNVSADLKTPSIAIGEGNMNGDRVLIAYIVDDGTNDPYPEVAAKNLGGTGSATVQSIPHFSDPYALPIIKTDKTYYSNWYAFLVAEWQYDTATDNINIEYWRSTDGGLTWPDDSSNRKTPYGNTDPYEWRQPDIIKKGGTYYITAYRKDTQTIYLTTDHGSNINPVATLNYQPTTGAYPRIAGIPGNTNLMLVYSHKTTDGGYDRAYYTWSSNNGTSWNGPWILPGSYDDAHGRRPVIAATPYEPGYFHVIYTAGFAVFHYRRPVDLSDYYTAPKLVTDTNYASHTYGHKGIDAFYGNAHAFMAWSDYRPSNDPLYQIFGDRTYPDDLLGTWTGQGVYFRTEQGNWFKMATPADLITTGDLDNDGTDDLIGVWPGQGGVWAKYSGSGSWAKLSSTATWITTGDMNGNGRDDLVGTWDGQGVYYKDSVTGDWIKLATPATKIAAGDLDGDGTDDLIGIWPGQGGVWVKYSSTGDWVLLSSTARDIAVGDMNGNGRVDLLGTWDGQGVYYKHSVTGDWIKLGTPADQISAGDLDSDFTDDLIGIWPGQGGVWVKYSQTGTWKKLSSTADHMTAGMMRGGGGSWMTGAADGLFEPVGGEFMTEPYLGMPGAPDLSASGPGGSNFLVLMEEKNLVPAGREALKPGPGRSGFTFKTAPNLVPAEKIQERKER